MVGKERSRSLVAKGTYVRRLSNKLYVLDMLRLEPISTLLLGRRWWPYILASKFFARNVAAGPEYLNCENPILWLFAPIAAPVVEKIKSRLVVFDALDNWLTHEGMSPYRKASRDGYAVLRKKAHLIFCGSAQMREYLKRSAAPTHWVPNGVDTKLFTIESSQIPLDLSNLPEPRVGYVGVIDSRLDLDILCYCARLLPNMSFVFVGWKGKAKSRFRELERSANVHFLGAKSYQLMPQYIAAFDVCLLPHKLNAYTEGMSPLKLFEYLACGKPVVSTPVAGTECFGGVIMLAETKEEFVKCIVRAIEEDCPTLSYARRRAVIRHSWSERVQLMWRCVEERLAPK